MVKVNNKVVKCVLAYGILASVVSISLGAMSDEEWERAGHNCFNNDDKSACVALINNGLASVEQCDKDTCGFVGAIYSNAGRYREAIPYYEKAIALGDRVKYNSLGFVYHKLQDYYNAKKYYEIGCNNGNGGLDHAEHCYNLGVMYHEGEGVRQDYAKARELYKKSCDMKYGNACNNIGYLYDNGKGVKQNLFIAKHNTMAKPVIWEAKKGAITIK